MVAISSKKAYSLHTTFCQYDSALWTELCHYSSPQPLHMLAYWGDSESDFFCHSVGPRLYDCARIPLAHPI